MAVNIKTIKKEGVATVEVTKPGGETTNTRGSVEGAETDSGELAYVAVEIGYTKNLGDFNSLKLHVRVSRPCENSDEAIEECANWNKDFCENKIAQFIEG